MPCKCGQRYCQMHRMPEAHTCSFDFKQAERAQLEKTLVTVAGDKMAGQRI
jgi:hypothetical protein